MSTRTFTVFLLFCSIFHNEWEELEALIGKDVKQAKPNQFPFVVFIANTSPGESFFCTGSLITQTHVLTSEHCVPESDNLKNFYIKTGSIDIDRGDKHEVIAHKSYGEWFLATKGREPSPSRERVDMAVLTLAKPVKNIKLPVLVYKKKQEYYGQHVKAVGWGVTNTHKPAEHLQYVELKVINYNDCMENTKEILHKRVIVSEDYICTIAKPYGYVQSGDSGGPLLLNDNEIVAVNSETLGPADEKDDDKMEKVNNKSQQNVHADIYYSREFIESVIGKS